MVVIVKIIEKERGFYPLSFLERKNSKKYKLAIKTNKHKNMLNSIGNVESNTSQINANCLWILFFTHSCWICKP